MDSQWSSGWIRKQLAGSLIKSFVGFVFPGGVVALVVIIFLRPKLNFTLELGLLFIIIGKHAAPVVLVSSCFAL